MNMAKFDKPKESDKLEYNFIVNNFRTKKFDRFQDNFAIIKTFLFFIFKTRKLQPVSKIKLILSPTKFSIDATFLFEYQCRQNQNRCKFSMNVKGGLGIISAKFFEPVVYKFMSFVNGDVFVDIGANIGVYSLLSSTRFGKVISVEPGEVQRMLLNKNIKLNHINNIEVLGNAICKEEGIIKLYKSDNLVNYSIVQKSNDYEEVNCITLDQLLLNLKHVELLKIDVEGAEMDVIKGGLHEINKVHFIIIEVRNSYFKDMIQILNKIGFKYHVLEDRTIGEKNVLFINTLL